MFILFLGLTVACSSSTPLGDGTLSGRLPDGWNDSSLTGQGAILRVTDHRVPLPAELLITETPIDPGPGGEDWVVVGKERRPAPETRVGDRWQENTRDVRIYRKRFSDGRLLEAAVDIRFDRSQAESFLRSLAPTAR